MGASSAWPIRTVLLLHALPDGSSHIDFFLGPRVRSLDMQLQSDAKCLVGFRLDRRPDDLAAGAQIKARRMPDHRARYLDFEGPLSDNRGRVKRLRSGAVLGEIDSLDESGSLDISIEWNEHGDRPAQQQHILLEQWNGDDWVVTSVAMRAAASHP